MEQSYLGLAALLQRATSTSPRSVLDMLFAPDPLVLYDTLGQLLAPPPPGAAAPHLVNSLLPPFLSANPSGPADVREVIAHVTSEDRSHTRTCLVLAASSPLPQSTRTPLPNGHTLQEKEDASGRWGCTGLTPTDVTLAWMSATSPSSPLSIPTSIEEEQEAGATSAEHAQHSQVLSSLQRIKQRKHAQQAIDLILPITSESFAADRQLVQKLVDQSLKGVHTPLRHSTFSSSAYQLLDHNASFASMIAADDAKHAVQRTTLHAAIPLVMGSPTPHPNAFRLSLAGYDCTYAIDEDVPPLERNGLHTAAWLRPGEVSLLTLHDDSLHH
jgi:hypothetical protein